MQKTFVKAIKATINLHELFEGRNKIDTAKLKEFPDKRQAYEITIFELFLGKLDKSRFGFQYGIMGSNRIYRNISEYKYVLQTGTSRIFIAVQNPADTSFIESLPDVKRIDHTYIVSNEFNKGNAILEWNSYYLVHSNSKELVLKEVWHHKLDKLSRKEKKLFRFDKRKLKTNKAK